MENRPTNPRGLVDLQPKPANGGVGGSEDEIEMLAFQGLAYTSLKDLIPLSRSRSASPTSGCSWKEIPFKDPLVKHAAWAYLKPMAEARDEEGPWWKRMLAEKCGGIWGCFNDVVLVMCRGFFGEQASDDGEE